MSSGCFLHRCALGFPEVHVDSSQNGCENIYGHWYAIWVVAIYVVAALMGSVDAPKRHHVSAFWSIVVLGFCLSGSAL